MHGLRNISNRKFCKLSDIKQQILIHDCCFFLSYLLWIRCWWRQLQILKEFKWEMLIKEKITLVMWLLNSFTEQKFKSRHLHTHSRWRNVSFPVSQLFSKSGTYFSDNNVPSALQFVPWHGISFFYCHQNGTTKCRYVKDFNMLLLIILSIKSKPVSKRCLTHFCDKFHHVCYSQAD